MLSRSYLNLLNLDDSPVAVAPAPSPTSAAPRPLNRLPRVISEPGIISDYGHPPLSPSSSDDGSREFPPERRIVVAHQLPVKCHRDAAAGEWRFELDNDALVLHLKDGFPAGVEVWYVGCLRAEIDPSEQDAVSAHLAENFRCLPAFISPDVHNRFYHGFCKHYLWPLFHYKLPMSPSQGYGGAFGNGVGYRSSDWQAYVSANMIFADKIMEIVNPDEDFIWVHDYHLMVLPTILRRRFGRMKLGFFLHSPFPSSEIYRTIPVREEILKSLLNADLVGFHTFDYARHFLSCCRRMLGLEYRSRRGYIGLEYYGRTVSIKILPVGIHMGQLQSLLSMPETARKLKELKEEYSGKTVIVGVDDMDVLKGISFKFWAMGRLLELHPGLRGKAVLVQITNPPRSRGRDVQEVQLETHSVADEVNRKYGQPGGYTPIVFIDSGASTSDKAAYYALADCCMVNAVRDGMNLMPYEYTVCRQGSPVVDDATSGSSRTSVIVVSEFIGCSPSLSGAIRVNPWNVECLAEAMCEAITMPKAEKELRHEKHYKYISSHDVAYWARSFDQDLKRACADHNVKRFWGMGFGWGFRVIALGPHFRRLTVDHIVSAYGRTKNRLILLDYDGTIKAEGSADEGPSKEIISVLNCLCRDENNVVFLVSGRGRVPLSNWFSPCEKLGLSAEHGFLTRWSRDSQWESSIWDMDFEWKRIVKPIMTLYTETTDGSYIEEKESALVWHHGAADPDFASCQSKELLDHLENVLANEPVCVKRGQHTVEVKPQGVNKGVLVEKLMETMKEKKGASPDFLLCIGDDRSDEDMFESIARRVSNPSLPSIAEVFACTVGQKPSMAKYYLDDTTQVVNLLQGVARASLAQHPGPVQLGG